MNAWANYDDVVDQLRKAGFDVTGGLDVSGKVKRVKVKDITQKGWYVLREIRLDDGRFAIVGAYGWWVGAEKFQFKIELRLDGAAPRLTDEQIAAIKARIDEDRKRAEADRQREADRAARRAQAVWAKCLPVGSSDYLTRKGVQGYGVRYSPSGALVIPMLDLAGRVHGLQVIYAKKKNGRDKDFWPAGLAMKGHFFHIGGIPTGLVLVAEGYATAASLHQATGLPVVVAFTAGNLLPVVKQIHKRYRAAKILVCADDDYLTEGNPGVSAASAAALVVGGAVAVPEFSQDRAGEKITDFNDLHAREGLQAVKAQIEARLLALGWSVPGTGAAKPRAMGEGGDSRPEAVSVMDLDSLVERFLPIDDGTGKLVFDKWTNKLAHRDQMQALLPAGSHRDDIKRHPLWIERGGFYLDEIGFDPSMEDKGVRLNTWQGWAISPKQGSCDLILDLIAQQCSKEKEISSAILKWLLQWMAWPLQNPGAKMGSAVVMHGPQGTGKSLIFGLLAEIYGYKQRRRNYAIVIDGQSLHAKFNLDWENKLFILAEEVVNASEKWELKNQLKHLVTGDTLRVEGKHLNAVHNRNLVNVVFLSNDVLPFPIDPDDRRHLVIYTPPPLDKSFFRDVLAEIKNGGREAFYWYLLNRVDCSDFDHTKPPMTEAKKMLMRISSSSDIRFLTDWSLGELGLPVCPAESGDVYSAYVRWCRNNGELRPRAAEYFFATIHHLNSAGWEKKKCRIYTSETTTVTTPKPLVLPPAAAMEREGTAQPEGKPVAAWLTESVRKFRKALTGEEQERNEWAA